jgi:hypothetical protein
MEIYQTYNEKPGLDHYLNYGVAYDENIHQVRDAAVRNDSKVKMLEIGVQSGGSTRVWKRYFGARLDYVGVDVNPNCRQFESLNEGIRIVIGSQLDRDLLGEICREHGPFDFVVDDGGHGTNMIMTSLDVLWNCLVSGTSSDIHIYTLVHIYNIIYTYM